MNKLLTKSKCVLAIDFGTKTGWALFYEDKIISGTENTLKKKGKDGLRFVNFFSFLKKMREEYPISEVCYEKVCRHTGVQAAHVYGAFWGILNMWCDYHNIRCYNFYVPSIKKFISGKGNASKEEVIASVKLKGFNPCDDNEADALSLLLLSLDQQ
jgi:crossover junction endodeoxyribonuclease RuvC